MTKQRVKADEVEKAIGEPLKPLIKQLLEETQSYTLTAALLSERSGIEIDYGALYYLRMKLGITTTTRIEVH